MTWFVVDDKFGESKKVKSIPRGQRMAAVGLWTMAGQWSAGQLSDGHVPEYMVEELGGNARLSGVLVASGLWERTDDGFVFHDWAEWQQTKEQVEKKRADARSRMAKLRGSSGEVRANSDVTSGEVREQFATPFPSLPIPTQSNPPSSAEEGREDIDRICEHLADRIEGNGSKRPTVAVSWRREARLLLDKDEHTEDEIHALIDWCQDDSFWRSNVLSLPKLREKYDQLALKARTPRAVNSRQQQTDDMFARAARRAAEADRKAIA